MPTVCETYARAKAVHHLEAGRVVICAAGTGLPFFTTDTGAALRAAEMGCDALFKGTSVDGVYSADPKVDPSAKRFERITFSDILARDLRIMDPAAIALARDNGIPVVVFSIRTPGAVLEAGQVGYVIAGIKAVYTVSVTQQDNSSLMPIPPSLDSTPIALLWYRGTFKFLPGNEERIAWRVDALIWERGADGGYGYTTLMPFADLFVPAFRSQAALTLDGVVTKCQIAGVGEIFPQTINNGQLYLVLPIPFDLLNVYHSHDYSS